MVSLLCCSRRITISIEYVEEEKEEYAASSIEEESEVEEEEYEADEEYSKNEEEYQATYEKIPEHIPEEIPEKIPEHIPEPPKLAHKKPNYNHRYWPSPRAVLFAKYLYAYHLKKPCPPRLTHTVALELLAKHVNYSVEDFLKINPLTFIEKYLGNTKYLFTKSIIDSREYSNLHSDLTYETKLAEAKKHKAETQQPIE